MKTKYFRWPNLAVLALILATSSYAGESSDSSIVIRIDRRAITITKPKTDISRERFERDWGQFELRIAKKDFPIAAPNCKSGIILRMPGVDPRDADNTRKLQWQWEFFEDLVKSTTTSEKSVEIRLTHKPYMNITADGKFQLQYCNAFFENSSK